MRGSSSGRAALAFTVASFGGALLNYLFQVHAASVLDRAAFGALSAWLARVTMLGVVATVVQYVSLDHRLAEDGWRATSRVTGALALVVVVVHVLAGDRVPLVGLGVSAVGGGILLYALLGQLQARLQLGVMAIAILVAAASRFALPFVWPRDARAPGFFVAHAASSFAAVAAIGACVALRAQPGAVADATATKTEPRLRLQRPILLAFAASLFPLLDVLVVSATQDDATTGAFSRIALAARIVFFCGAAALQILLPHELHAATTGEPLPAFATTLRRWLTPASLAGAAVLAVGLDRMVLKPEGAERTWLFATCTSFALLVAILGHVNRFAAHERLRVAAFAVLGVVLTSAAAAGLAAMAGHEPVTRYLLAVVVGNALVLAGVTVAQRRSRAERGRAVGAGEKTEGAAP